MTDCIIVGGGLIGMLTARELQQAGAKVLLIEKGQLGQESSWAGGGILSPLYPWRYPDAVNALAKFSQQIYQQIAAELLRESAVDPEYIQSGLLVLDQHEHDAAQCWADQWDMQLERLDKQQLQACEANISEQFDAALWMPEIAQMRNPRIVKALRGSLEQLDIPYLENTAVSGLAIEKQKVIGVDTEQQRYHADKVIIAGGAWSRGIIEQYGCAPEVEPVKGQMIIFKTEPDLVKRIILDEGRYVIPRKDGRVLTGSTLEHTGFDKQTTDAALADLKASALALIPALADYNIEHHWSGLRPGSHAGVPYICEHPDVSGLFMNAGHYRNGVILGAASARLMCSLVMNQQPELDPLPYTFSAAH